MTRLWPVFILVGGLVLAFPDWLYRIRLMLHERGVRTSPAYTRIA